MEAHMEINPANGLMKVIFC